MDESEKAGAVDQGRKLAIEVGLSLLALLVLAGAWFGLQGEASPLEAGPRSAIFLLVGMLATVIAGRILFEAEVPYQGLPIARTAFSMLGAYLVYWALKDLCEASWLPFHPWGAVLAGGLLLAASIWSDSVLIALVGAELIDQQVALNLGARFGFYGGLGTSAIWFYAGVAAVELPLGWWIARHHRRAVGVGIMCNGGWSLVWAFLVLGAWGAQIHRCPEYARVFYVFFAAAVGLSVLLARLLARLKSEGMLDLASRGVIIALSFVLGFFGVPSQLAFLISTLAFHAMAAQGIFQPADEGAGEVPPEAFEDPQKIAELLMKRLGHDPASARLEPAAQARAVRVALVATLAAWLGLGGAGLANRRLASPEAFRIPVTSAEVTRRLESRVSSIDLPDDLPRGAAIDCWLVPEHVDYDKLWFLEAVVVPRGAPPPDGIEPGKAWRIPGRIYDVVTYKGARARGIFLEGTLGFTLPKAWEGRVVEGSTLVFAQGALGYTYPASVLAPEAGPPPPDESWLGGAQAAAIR